MNQQLPDSIAQLVFEDLLAHQKKHGWYIHRTVSIEDLVDSLMKAYDELEEKLNVGAQVRDIHSARDTGSTTDSTDYTSLGWNEKV